MSSRSRRMNSPTYKQVPTSSDQADANAEQAKKIRTKTLDQVSAKVHALFWVATAIALIFYLDIGNVVLNDVRVNRVALNLAVFSFFSNVTICLYLIFWLPYVKKNTLPWEVFCPRMIPTATALGLTCIISAILAMWPVWGFLSPLIIFFLCLGLMMFSHFIPWPF